MVIDERIKDISLIGNPFNAENFKSYIGKKCYVSSRMNTFWDLDKCNLKTLARINTMAECPYIDDAENRWEFCLPAELVTKIYRPYTLKEFFDKFTIGQPIRYRKKGDLLERYLILEGYVDSKGDDKENRYQYIHIGSTPYSLDELFNKYEWQERYTEEFKPFGVEE